MANVRDPGRTATIGGLLAAVAALLQIGTCMPLDEYQAMGFDFVDCDSLGPVIVFGSAIASALLSVGVFAVVRCERELPFVWPAAVVALILLVGTLVRLPGWYREHGKNTALREARCADWD